MKLTIDRERWSRGGKQATYLLDSHGQMCCLGFYSLACGFTEAEIKLKALPTDLCSRETSPKNKRAWKKLFSKHVTHNTSEKEDLFAAINDRKSISDKMRESLLTKEFAEIGVDVKFVGGKKEPLS